MNKTLAFAMYKPNEGKKQELMDILKEHIPMLKEYGLITDRATITAESEDGTIIEIFEWASEEAKGAAHQHSAIMQMWGRMMPICSFPAMKDLPEAQKSFPNLGIIA
jgi:quinol monooxygenase YgiN